MLILWLVRCGNRVHEQRGRQIRNRVAYTSPSVGCQLGLDPSPNGAILVVNRPVEPFNEPGAACTNRNNSKVVWRLLRVKPEVVYSPALRHVYCSTSPGSSMVL